MTKRIIPIVLVAVLLCTALSGCAGTDRPLHAMKKELQQADAARLLDVFVQNYAVFDVSFGKGQMATLEVVFFENGKAENSVEVGPLQSDASGEYAFALMQYQSGGEASYKACILQMDNGASYTTQYSPKSGEGVHGARYATSREYKEDELPTGGRYPLYGIFYTGSAAIPAAPDMDKAIAESALSVVFYITVQAPAAQ